MILEKFLPRWRDGIYRYYRYGGLVVLGYQAKRLRKHLSIRLSIQLGEIFSVVGLTDSTIRVALKTQKPGSFD
jgi:hypothetical protein